jgi:uncharacterized protein YbbK (DUF523 family)
MTEKNSIQNIKKPSKENPLVVMMSACLTGLKCGYDGSSYGEYPSALKLLDYDTVRVVRFCPEEFSFGTPREMCDIHGGTGIDVLNGKAKVLTESGIDWTSGMVKASEKMLEIAKAEKVEIAIMMDTSAACGSQVIYDGNRFAQDKKYQIGMGVCAAQLKRNGFLVISQRDFASLEVLYSKIDEAHALDPTKLDHHETEWYKNYFKS